MAFDGKEGGFIDLSTACAMTKRYRDGAASGAVMSVFLGKDKLQELLAQSGAMGLRFYYGLDSNGALSLVVVSADSEQNDQLGAGDKILDMDLPCPGSGCPSSKSPLQG